MKAQNQRNRRKLTAEQKVVLCWICRLREADSREHKFKASDLRRFFGKGKWAAEHEALHSRGGDAAHVQGPGSKRMTFGRVLCARCNNQESKPFDEAYDRFVEWSMANKERVVAGRCIDFAEVYRDGWEDSQLQLFRYFAKHLGCNISGCEGHDVPEDLREVIHQTPFRTALRVTFHVHEDLLLGPGLDEGLWMGGLGHVPPDEDGIPTYWSDITVGWLVICFWYYVPTPDDATEWIADKQVVRLGARSVLTDEQREEVRRRGQGLPHRPAFEGES